MSQSEKLFCDFCGKETEDPWHLSSPHNKHLHACDQCHAEPNPFPRKTDILEAREAERIRQLEEYAKSFTKKVGKALNEDATADLYLSPYNANTPQLQTIFRQLRDQGWEVVYQNETVRVS